MPKGLQSVRQRTIESASETSCSQLAGQEDRRTILTTVHDLSATTTVRSREQEKSKPTAVQQYYVPNMKCVDRSARKLYVLPPKFLHQKKTTADFVLKLLAVTAEVGKWKRRILVIVQLACCAFL